MRSSEIHQLLAEHERSDLSLAAFAREKGVPAYRLYDARRRSRLKAAAAATSETRSRFSEVEVVDSNSPGSSTPIELRLPSGLALRLDRDFDEVALRRLLGVLASC